MFCIEFFYRNDIIAILYLRSLKMNFLHLKYLIEVEKYESISKAAQHLYINQPRLSKIIKEIEEEANIKIFERHNKGVVPTTKGREFLSQAKKIVQEVDYLKNMYQDDPHKLNLDICVPRSSYISEAFIEYLKMDNNMKKKLNLNYRETNSFDTIQNVYDGENNLGIVRFPLRDQDYYFNILNLKELTYEKLFTFDYQILISKDNPLKDKDIYMKDLKKQIELKHGDIHIQEDHHKHMNIYERGIQFELLNEIPETYMWVAPMPKKLLKQNDFVLKTCKDKKIPYVDYLIYRKGYVLSKEEKRHCREVLGNNVFTSADPQTIIRDQTQEIVNILPEYFASQVRVLRAQANQNAHQLRNLRIELSEERFRNASWRLSHDNEENIRGLETVALQSLPIWGVTALSVGKYLPITAGLFDLVVIDEATQMNIAQAIPLLFRAKRAAIVGDPKQLSFITHLGNRNDGQLRRLFKVHGLSLNRFKYSEFSLYDFAHSTPDAYRVFLSETFRSCSPIANYSSAYFYDESLEVATDEKQLKVPAFYKAGIDWCDATGEILQGVNHRSCYSEAEVKAVTDIVVSILRGAEFDGTLGVVTPFAAQARKIEESLELEFRKDRTRLDKAQLMVDTAHAFQGSERDVMIFSLCANANMPTGSMNFLREGKNIFNVAASRARSLLYVVGDKKWAEMCGIDFIQGLTKDWNRWSSQKYSRWAPYESPWEKKLAEKLLEHGLEVQPQWRVGCRRLDLALMEGAAKLDIEVDGETYHRDENNRRRADDFFRDEYLQRFGWKTQRFWVSELQDDLEGCAQEVVKVWNLLKTKVS